MEIVLNMEEEMNIEVKIMNNGHQEMTFGPGVVIIPGLSLDNE